MSEAKKTVLVCGGAGFIGSHTCVALIESGYVPVVWDNLCNSSKESLERVAALTGHRPQLTVIDLCNSDAVVEQMARLNAECGGITCVILFAALKAVGESVSQPLRYYQNNLVAGWIGGFTRRRWLYAALHELCSRPRPLCTATQTLCPFWRHRLRVKPPILTATPKS